MPVLLALDDTDTRLGGCTTATAFQIALGLDDAPATLAGWGLRGPARLVRLLPSAPHRTRGNGALVLPLGPRVGTPEVVGWRPDGTPLLAYPQGPDTPLPHDAAVALGALVRRTLPTPGANGQDPQPGALLLPRAPHPTLYQEALHRFLVPAEAWRHAPAGTIRLTSRPARGEIGALAAAAWDTHRWTWEATGYRDPATPRRTDAGFVAAIDRLSEGFDNHDPETGRVRCVPRTPCPVAWAVRGLDPHALRAFLAAQRPEAGGWVLQTNQATADHARCAGALPGPYRVLVARMTITGPPRPVRGGALLAPAHDPHGTALDLVAYEPTKTLRHSLARAVPGDRLRVLGRTGADPTTLALEGFLFTHTVPRWAPTPNPRCAPCGRAMKSRGRDAPLRCPACHAETPRGVHAPRAMPGPALGVWHQVPDHVRGHLLPPREGLAPAWTWDRTQRAAAEGPWWHERAVVA